MDPRSVKIHEMYDAHTLLIMRMLLQPKSSCIDVGAHAGSILSEIVKICPAGKHFAFEPIPHLYESLRATYPTVNVYDFACSDEEGESVFFHVKNAPAYSGLKKRRYDRSDPEIAEIRVKKCCLDKIIPADQRIDFIKIDVEGGELGVLRGAKRIIADNKPLLIFESGKGASDYYGTTGESIYDFLISECGMEINTLDGFLRGDAGLTRDGLAFEFNTVSHYYFVATRPLQSSERSSHLGSYLLDLDKRLFAMENPIADAHTGTGGAEQHAAAIVHRWVRRARVVWRRVTGNEELDLKVHNWGPREMVSGSNPNEQPGGGLGLWINVSGEQHLGEVQLLFSGNPLFAFISRGLITAAVPPELIKLAGTHEIVLRQVSTGKALPIGTFVINSSDNG